MTDLVQFKVGQEDSIWVDVDSAPRTGGVVKTSSDGGLAAVQHSMDASLDKLQRMCGLVLEKLKGSGPEEISVELGVRLDAKAGVVLASAGSGAHLNIKLVWKKP
jgi:vacuolar-type H+-ATPase subunit E/Vma4